MWRSPWADLTPGPLPSQGRGSFTQPWLNVSPPLPGLGAAAEGPGSVGGPDLSGRGGEGKRAGARATREDRRSGAQRPLDALQVLARVADRDVLDELLGGHVHAEELTATLELLVAEATEKARELLGAGA